ncbi:c-type cytochrome [bacterium]|nr:c-type cytochrome [bacterium]
MRSIYSLLLLLSVFVLGACSHSRHPDSLWYDPNNPGYEYAPAMYHSYPYEPLTQVTNENATSWYYNSTPYNDYKGKYKSNSLTPVAGTIARGKLDYYFEYENNDSGRAMAARNLVNPIELNDYTLNEGKRLFNLYCDHCHGEKGDGNGSLVEAGKIPTPGEYYGKLKDREAGSIFHTITYGKGIMGSHASQLSPEQRWLIVNWVQIMQHGAEAYKIASMSEYEALTAPAQSETPEMESVQDTTAVEEVMEAVDSTNQMVEGEI